MTSQPPPPGAPPPGSTPGSTPGSQPSWPPDPGRYPDAPGYGAAYGRPLHKPGTVPLRPLTLSDFFDGAFSNVRRNPRATIGLAAVVLVVAMAIPTVISLVLSGLNGFSTSNMFRPGSGASSGTEFDVVDLGLLVAGSVSGVFAALATIVISGLVVPVVTRASLGEYIAPDDAWRRARGSLLRLIGLALLEGVIATLVVAVLVGGPILLAFAADSVGLGVGLGILGVLVAIVGLITMHVRLFQLAAPALVTERIGVFAALRRAGRLSRGQFWRILGITLLMTLVTAIAQQVISIPFGLVGTVLLAAFPDHGGFLGYLISNNLATVVSGAVVTPFTGAVAVLMYLDQRFRKEGFDVELIGYTQSRSGQGRVNG